jgi:hypothetical protein
MIRGMEDPSEDSLGKFEKQCGMPAGIASVNPSNHITWGLIQKARKPGYNVSLVVRCRRNR